MGVAEQAVIDHANSITQIRSVAQCEMSGCFTNPTQTMKLTRHRSAWIWVAIAAIAVSTLARAQAGVQSATAYTHPVLEFLASHSNAAGHAASSDARLFGHRSDRQTRAALSDGANPGVWTAMLPVLFVGLVAPLSLVSPKFALSLGRTPSAPALPFSFQRPPPLLLS